MSGWNQGWNATNFSNTRVSKITLKNILTSSTTYMKSIV